MPLALNLSCHVWFLFYLIPVLYPSCIACVLSCLLTVLSLSCLVCFLSCSFHVLSCLFPVLSVFCPVWFVSRLIPLFATSESYLQRLGIDLPWVGLFTVSCFLVDESTGVDLNQPLTLVPDPNPEPKRA